jgi:hypothetical protein
MGVIQRLLPTGAAFLMAPWKVVTKLVAAIETEVGLFRTFAAAATTDLHPQTTRFLEDWEVVHGLPGFGGEADRRDLLELAWRRQTNESLDTLNAILHAHGFTDLELYEWFLPGIDPLRTGPVLDAELSSALFALTEFELMSFDAIRDRRGVVSPRYVCLAGQTTALAGLPTAQAGSFVGYLTRYETIDPFQYAQSSDAWRGVLFLGPAGVNFTAGDPNQFHMKAPVPASKRAELENLVLRIRNGHLWIVLLVEYI